MPGPSSSIRIRIESGRAEVRILIEDEGPGIPEDQQERVFEPFVRLEELRSDETGGIGLGLAIARSILRAHGGDIRLHNRPEGGLAVSLNLPPAPTGLLTPPTGTTPTWVGRRRGRSSSAESAPSPSRSRRCSIAAERSTSSSSAMRPLPSRSSALNRRASRGCAASRNHAAYSWGDKLPS